MDKLRDASLGSQVPMAARGKGWLDGYHERHMHHADALAVRTAFCPIWHTTRRGGRCLTEITVGRCRSNIDDSLSACRQFRMMKHVDRRCLNGIEGKEKWLPETQATAIDMRQAVAQTKVISLANPSLVASWHGR